MMTPERRLDQLEPLVAEISAQLDRVVAQNRQLALGVNQVAEAVTMQSDNVQFLIDKVSKLEAGQAEMQRVQGDTNQKVDLILQILQRGNGH